MAYDIIGSKEKSIVILDKKAKVLPEEILRRHKNVTAILMKVSPRKNKYRTYKLKLLVGDSNTEVVHKEHGFKFVLDPKKVYFSPREATERKRVSKIVRNNDIIMVFFAGIGPLAIYLARQSKKVIGIEKNPFAIKYFKENVKLNKINNIEIVYGDVKEKAKKYKNLCNHVFMPLPEEALKYLRYAISCIKIKGIVHVYFFSKEDVIEKMKKKMKLPCIKSISIHRVLPYAPKIWKYRADLYVEK